MSDEDFKSTTNFEAIASEARAAGETEATVWWKLDTAKATEQLAYRKYSVARNRARTDRLARQFVTDSAERRERKRRALEGQKDGTSHELQLAEIEREHEAWVQERNEKAAAEHRHYSRLERLDKRIFRRKMMKAHVTWGLSTAAAAVKTYAGVVETCVDAVVTWCGTLYRWFWRSPVVRWTMIFLCAFAAVFFSWGLWLWLVFGGKHPISIAGDPIPDDRMPVIFGLSCGIPYLAAWIRVSETIDIARGHVWPLRGKAWWMAALRVAQRAIVFVPITVAVEIGALYALVLLHRFAPSTGAWLLGLTGSWVNVPEIEIVALIIVGAWRLSVKFLTGRSAGGGGFFSQLDAALKNAWKSTEPARGVFGGLMALSFGSAVAGGIGYLLYRYWPEHPFPGFGAAFASHRAEWIGWGVDWFLRVLPLIFFWMGLTLALSGLRGIVEALGKGPHLGKAAVHGTADIADINEARGAAPENALPMLTAG